MNIIRVFYAKFFLLTLGKIKTAERTFDANFSVWGGWWGFRWGKLFC